MALRILTAMFMVGIMDTPQTGNLGVNATSDTHNRLARELAVAANILVKNQNNVLPINPTNIKNIAIIGDDAQTHPTAVGYGSGNVQLPYLVTPLQGINNFLSGNRVNVNYADSSNVTGATTIAKSADYVIIFVAVDSSEGADRSTLSLGDEQNNLISTIAPLNQRTIVVIHSPGPVLMPWVDSVNSIIMAMLPGQEDGNAIAEVLFGKSNPSAKLPYTIPRKASEIPVNTITQYPGINNEAQYSEGLLVGYRWYDARNVAPLFEFGFGLSYTTFQFSGLSVSGSIRTRDLMVSFTVRNTGSVAGAEVAQLYLGFPSSAGEPPKQLKGFEKVYLLPGQSQQISLWVGPEAVSIWDVSTHRYTVVSGTFGVFVGSSSRNLPLTSSFNV